MAKELPYFKFEPNEWENGNIQMLSREDKGLFIDLCCMYWSRLGDLPYRLAIQKVCGGNANALNPLFEDDIISTDEDDIIVISFLQEQLSEFSNIRNQNSKNAKDGWEKRRKQKELSERNATAYDSQSESDAIREEKRRGEEIKELIYSFDDFWKVYGKSADKKKCSDKFYKLSVEDLEGIKLNLPKYILSTPDVQYRKNPLTWLNGKCWNDEVSTPQQEQNLNSSFYRISV